MSDASMPWWVAAIGALGSSGLGAAIAKAFIARAAERTARYRIDSGADKGAFERAFDVKAVEHRECIEEVKGLRDEIADVRVKLARCEEQHDHAREERERDRAEYNREIASLRSEIKRVDRKTPAGGMPAVNKENA